MPKARQLIEEMKTALGNVTWTSSVSRAFDKLETYLVELENRVERVERRCLVTPPKDNSTT